MGYVNYVVIDRLLKQRDRRVADVRRFRERHAWFDHLIRSVERYVEIGGDRLAASVAFYGILSFFPLVALAYALVGYAVTFSPHAADYVYDVINDLLPGLANEAMIEDIASAKEGAGIIGLVGLVWAGLGWIGALRDALRVLWVHGGPQPGYVRGKLVDLAALAGFGGSLLLSVIITSVATTATSGTLAAMGLSDSLFARIIVRVLGSAGSFAADAVILLMFFWWLSRAQEGFRTLLRGALVGAAGLVVLKLAGTFLVSFTTGNAVYGAFALLVGILVWIYISMRWVLYAATWTATSAR